MKIFSYNVNGLRAAINKGFLEWLNKERPDVICLQETKLQPSQISPAVFESLGYSACFHSAEKKGYSGVAILTRKEPDKILKGMGNRKYDSEGRVMRADFGPVSLINAYIPSGTTGGVRQDFKMEFLDDFSKFISELKQQREKLIICGDYNICHKPIDINHPERHKKSSGFLPEERAWFDEFIASGLTDTFRLFNREPEQYSWWSYRANSREKNLGWRIDYHLVTNNLKNSLVHASILQHIKHSDHCPVALEIQDF